MIQPWAPDTLLVKGDVGVDSSTSRTGVNDWPQPRHLGQYCSPIPETLQSPTRSTHQELCFAYSAILAQLQSDVRILKMASPIRLSPKLETNPVPHRSVWFTNTAVPRSNREACWYQHQHMFDAIVKSNEWDDETATLQIFAHLEGDALNVALLLPEAQRATRIGLSGTLSNHYTSPGRLAFYRRKFENAVWRDGEDPSIFATELETLAAQGFGDAGPSARIQMVRDWFVTGHRDCELRRHLDSVAPDTPIQDIVDQCRVWESHSNIHFSYQKFPAITKNYRKLPTIADDRPLVPAAIVQTKPPIKSTVTDIYRRLPTIVAGRWLSGPDQPNQ